MQSNSGPLLHQQSPKFNKLNPQPLNTKVVYSKAVIQAQNHSNGLYSNSSPKMMHLLPDLYRSPFKNGSQIAGGKHSTDM